ncbi:hypothetical protein J437_LFUL016033 [Ladona fulva]|uniref:Phospholipase B1, membrane-associated n=1 Tax=Ladona fulva TaxID=123851 RepID=A0A8K0KIV0_LADFU|nr:hypothetical protein J437_LFUL016033 [Ladona fulva]
MPSLSLVRPVSTLSHESRKLRYPAADDYRKRLQERVSENVPFKCDESISGVKSRSETRPLSVHRLRPGDIDVIAALGDSIAAGNGAREVSPRNSFIEDRGVAFTGGGIGSWRSFTTIPNILKVFNPKLVGHAVGKGSYHSYNAQLNVAVPASIDDETLYQAKFLVDKMKSHPAVDFELDWKFLSILIGHNDVCSLQCFNKTKHSPEAHKQQLQMALDYLYNNVPRLFVSVIPLIDPSISARVQTRTLYCNILRVFVCNCLYQKRNIKEGLFDLSDLVSRYQEAERQLKHHILSSSQVYSGRYDSRDDFTVELQPFSKALNGPRNAKEKENKRMIQFFNEFHPWTPDLHSVVEQPHGTSGKQIGYLSISHPQGHNVSNERCPLFIHQEKQHQIS